jgi:hypothetical protein
MGEPGVERCQDPGSSPAGSADQEDPAELFLVGTVAGGQRRGSPVVRGVHPGLLRAGHGGFGGVGHGTLADAGMVLHGRFDLGGREGRRGLGGKVQERCPGSEGAGLGDGINPALDVDAGSEGVGGRSRVRGVEFGKLHAGCFLIAGAGIHGDGYAAGRLSGGFGSG